MNVAERIAALKASADQRELVLDAVAVSLAHEDLFYLGVNCSTGPDDMTDYVRTLAGVTRFKLSCVTNAGIPETGTGKHMQTPKMMASVLERFGEQGWLDYLGRTQRNPRRHQEGPGRRQRWSTRWKQNPPAKCPTSVRRRSSECRMAS